MGNCNWCCPEVQNEEMEGLVDAQVSDAQPEPEPQPTNTFTCLPDNYARHHIGMEGIPNVPGEIAQEAKEIFETEALDKRRAVDTHLREFKKSVGENPGAGLPACFSSWRNKAFTDTELDTFKGENLFTVDRRNVNGNVPAVFAVYVNKDHPPPEAVEIGGVFNNLLRECHDFLRDKESKKQRLGDKIEEYRSKVSTQTRQTMGVLTKLQHLCSEIDKFANDIAALLMDISAALPYGVKSRGYSRSGTYPTIQK